VKGGSGYGIADGDKTCLLLM